MISCRSLRIGSYIFILAHIFNLCGQLPASLHDRLAHDFQVTEIDRFPAYLMVTQLVKKCNLVSGQFLLLAEGKGSNFPHRYARFIGPGLPDLTANIFHQEVRRATILSYTIKMMVPFYPVRTLLTTSCNHLLIPGFFAKILLIQLSMEVISWNKNHPLFLPGGF